MALYHLIRFFIAVAIAAIPFLLLRRTLQSKALAITAVVVFFVVNMALSLFPAENAFMSFATPEKAARYTGIGEVVCVAEGEESGLLITKQRSGVQVQIYPKKDGKWQIGTGISFSQSSYAMEKGMITLYQYKPTGEHYISVILFGTDIPIHDSVGSVFQTCKQDELAAEHFSEYYAYIPQFDDTYTLTINGTTIALTEDSPHLVKGLF